VLMPTWHFALVALVRCEIQAIDQHWSLHRIAISADGRRDESLAKDLDFAQLASTAPHLTWPALSLSQIGDRLGQAVREELEPDLVSIRERQQKYLGRELERVDTYFANYEKELIERERRARASTSKLQAADRLAAAKTEHARRRQDQIHRHEIRVMAHTDALLLMAEPAWQGQVAFIEKGSPKEAVALFLPRCRRWVVPTLN
jgi:hypothetical protein